MLDAFNDNTISYILGFKWGYEEWSDGGERHVRMLPFEIISSSEWEYRLPMLRKDFDSLKFIHSFALTKSVSTYFFLIIHFYFLSV